MKSSRNLTRNAKSGSRRTRALYSQEVYEESWHFKETTTRIPNPKLVLQEVSTRKIHDTKNVKSQNRIAILIHETQTHEMCTDDSLCLKTKAHSRTSKTKLQEVSTRTNLTWRKHVRKINRCKFLEECRNKTQFDTQFDTEMFTLFTFNMKNPGSILK